jgi:hypothetical protein
MRIGNNPAKEHADVTQLGTHRIIIPVYIPHQDGYFEHALDVLRLCLASLRLTTAGKAAITVIANGCASVIEEELEREFTAGWLDQLLLNQENRGKTDAVVSAARSCYEPLITIADCDVLFRAGWLEAVEELYQAFPEAGFVSPFPSPAGIRYHTSATFLEALVRGELRFKKVVQDEDLDRFARSIGQPDFFKPEFRHAQMVVRRQGITACVGAGHFIFTLRREMVNGMPAGPSLKALDASADQRWLDVPPDQLGFWRLSTPRAWVEHMGNHPEQWMHEVLAELARQPLNPATQAEPPPHAPFRWPQWVPVRLRRKLLQGTQRRWVQRIIYRSLGYPLVNDTD